MVWTWQGSGMQYSNTFKQWIKLVTNKLQDHWKDNSYFHLIDRLDCQFVHFMIWSMDFINLPSEALLLGCFRIMEVIDIVEFVCQILLCLPYFYSSNFKKDGTKICFNKEHFENAKGKGTGNCWEGVSEGNEWQTPSNCTSRVQGSVSDCDALLWIFSFPFCLLYDWMLFLPAFSLLIAPAWHLVC